jgi:hypothetical protein
MLTGHESFSQPNLRESLLQSQVVLALIDEALPQLQEAFGDTVLAPYFSKSKSVPQPTAVSKGRKAVYTAHKTMDDYNVEIALEISYPQKRRDDVVAESLRFKFPKAGNFFPEVEHVLTAFDGVSDIRLNTPKAAQRIRSTVRRMKKAK